MAVTTTEEHVIVKLKADTKSLDRDMKKASDTVTKSSTKMANAVASLAGPAFMGGLSASMYAVVKAGFSFNASMEQNITGISSLISATSQLVDSQGNAVTQQELLNIARLEAVDIVSRLNAINADTPHTLDQTNRIFKAMLPGMRALNVGYTDMIDITKKISIASGAAGIEFNSLLAGVDGLASGTVMANSDLGRLLNSLGLSNRALKSTDNIVALLNKKLEGFAPADTMAVNVSNLSNAWEKFAGVVTSDSFSNAKESMKGLADILNGITEGFDRARVQEGDIFGLKDTSEINKRLMFNLEQQAVMKEKISGYSNLEKTFRRGALEDDKTSLANLKKEEQTLISLYEIKQKERSASTVAKKLTKEVSAAEVSAINAEMVAYHDKNQAIMDGIQLQTDAQMEFTKSVFELIAAYDGFDEAGKKIEANMETLNTGLEQNIITQEEYNTAVENMGIAWAASGKQGAVVMSELEKNVASLKESVGTQLENAMTNTIRSWMDGALDFKDLMGNLLKDIAAEMIRVLVIKQALYGSTGEGGIMSLFAADGAAFSSSGATMFAKGGVVNGVTPFQYSGGSGIMGEAGPEAIVPLSRASDGTLGINAEGMGGTTVNIINNSNSEITTQEDENGLTVLIEAVSNSIASGITRRTNPVSGAVQQMINQRG